MKELEKLTWQITRGSSKNKWENQQQNKRIIRQKVKARYFFIQSPHQMYFSIKAEINQRGALYL